MNVKRKSKAKKKRENITKRQPHEANTIKQSFFEKKKRKKEKNKNKIIVSMPPVKYMCI